MRLPILSLTVVAALAATTHAQSFDDDDDAAAPAPASTPPATDGTPRFTVGAARALAGVAGPAASFGATDALQVDAIVGIASFTGAMAGPTSALGIEVGVRWMLASRGPASLSAGVRAGIAHTGGPMGTSTTDYLIEAPTRLELAITRWLRMYVEGGFAARYQPGSTTGGGDGSGSGYTTESTTTWRLGSNGAAAGAGFSVAF
jgi:hypothetical protein